MLPKENRLKKKKEFETVFKSGRSVKGQDFFLKYLGNGTDKIKVGFVVSKKVSKKAVERNRAKRRLREVFRIMDGEIKSGLSIVIVAYPSLKTRKFGELKQEIENVLRKGELIK